MDPASYEAWYATPRGRWVAETEFALLLRLLDLPPGASLLDVGCGTGQFTRRFAQAGYRVTGLDPDPERIVYARQHGAGTENHLTGDGTHLAFADKQFDAAVAVASLCFVEDQIGFVREMLRVARRRIVLGLLNRHSLLHLQKGRDGGQGGYRSAHWHSLGEARALLHEVGLSDSAHGSAVFLPNGGGLAQAIERVLPARWPFGAFLAVAASPA
ncbi:MAG: class I SAM-dependent methyltransferase [Betaproteobacteria bacterium]|nr:class I SAM-dependent methyltransferase [Betaproteobacteria bacterium]